MFVPVQDLFAAMGAVCLVAHTLSPCSLECEELLFLPCWYNGLLPGKTARVHAA